MDAHKYLSEWIRYYFISKDAFYHKIKSINVEEDCDFLITEEEVKKVVFIIEIFTDKAFLDKFVNYNVPNTEIILITLNNKSNISFLYSNWKEFLAFKSLSIYFINPFSLIDKRWIICPYIHNKISEPSALKRGLESMGEQVDYITKEDVLEKARKIESF